MVRCEIKVWTKSSFECYLNNCVCSEKCSNYKLCQELAKEKKAKGVPPIKAVVNALLDNGTPIPLEVTNSIVDTITQEDAKFLRLFTTEAYKGLKDKLNTTQKGIDCRLSRLLVQFKGNFSSRPADKVASFKSWSKETLIPELDRLAKEGVLC